SRSSAIPLTYLFIRFFSSIKVYLLYYSVDIVHGVNQESCMLFLIFVVMLLYNYFCIILFFKSLSNLTCFNLLLTSEYVNVLFFFSSPINGFSKIFGKSLNTS